MKNLKLKLLMTVLVMFSCTLFFPIYKTKAIYKEVKSTTISLTVVDPASTATVRFFVNDGSGNHTDETYNINDTLGVLTTPTRENYNFMGWYDENDNKVSYSTVVTGDLDLYAHWVKIICKKVTNVDNLNTETCSGSSGGCRTNGTGYSPNGTITYGTIFDEDSPVAGDAYDCDIDNDGTYDATANGKHIARFYFVRDKENQGSEDTAVLIYYTSYDATHGRVDTQSIGANYNTIGSGHYDVALGWLPTSSTTGWSNPGLIDFNTTPASGETPRKITRFLSVDDLESVCGPLASNGTADAAYLKTCFNKTNTTGVNNWFMFENSRFQSNTLGRAGIWLEYNGVHYARIQTSSLAVNTYSTGTDGDNMARPVIEIPMSALDGFVNATKYTISFDTHGGDSIESIKRYEGSALGTLPEPTREHYTFAGWYATYDSVNDEYSDQVSASTIVSSAMTLHAKWTSNLMHTVTFDANGGTIDGESTYELEVDDGVAIGENDYPEPVYEGKDFDGWYIEDDPPVEFDPETLITEDLTLTAHWIDASYVAIVNGVGYETLEAAINAVPASATPVKTNVRIIKNITQTTAITIPSNKWVELEGGNYTISSDISLITNEGKLDIISGTISVSNTTTNTIITNAQGATLNISGGTISNNSYVSGATTEFLAISNNGTANITGGTITSYGQSATINNNKGTLDISGGSIIAHNVTKGQAVYLSGGAVNISGNAYLENTSGTGESRACVDNNGGKLTITGGTIHSNNYSAVIARKSGNGIWTTIGNDDNTINRTTPILRGKRYGLEVSSGVTANVYDGIFLSENNTTAVSGPIADQPTPFYDDPDTTTYDGRTYHVTYLDEPAFTVNFYTETNTLYDTVDIQNGDTIGASNMPTPDPTKSGYYFDGWYDENVGEITSATEVTRAINAYAKWVQSIANATMDSTISVEFGSTVAIEYEEDDIESVTYLPADSSVATVDTNGVVTGEAIGSTTITLTGSKSGVSRTITVNVTPVMHTVTFLDADEETELFTRDIADNTSFGNALPIPTDEDYVFNTWYINGDTMLPFNGTTTVTGDLTLVASWKEKVTFATINTTPSPFVITVGNNGQISLSPTVSGDVVEGFTLSVGTGDDSKISIVNGEVHTLAVGTAYVIVTGNDSHEDVPVQVTIDPVRHTVSFNPDNGDSVTNVLVEDNTTIGANMPTPDPEKEDYMFLGWFDVNDASVEIDSLTVVTGAISAIAKWKPTVKTATVSPVVISLAPSDTETITVTPTTGMETYTFTSLDTSVATVTAGGVVTGVNVGTTTIRLVGDESHEYIEIPVSVSIVTYTVTFKKEATDVTPYATVSDILSGGLVSPMPTDPTKTGYVFGGWYVSGDPSDTFDGTTPVTDDITVIAKWKENIQTATVTINPDPLVLFVGTNGEITVSPTGSGNTVENYTISSSDSSIVSVSNNTVHAEDLGDVVLTIRGSESTLTRTINVSVVDTHAVKFMDGDTVIKTIRVADGATIDEEDLPARQTKSGYTFDDWYFFDGTEITSTMISTDKVILTDEIYKARWADENDVAAIGTTYFTSLSSAIGAVTDTTPTEIRLLKDYAIPSGRMTSDSGKDITINGNGYILSCGNVTSNLLYADSGTLRLKNGRFTCGKSGCATLETSQNVASIIYIYDTAIVTNTGDRGAIYNNGIVYILGGTISSTATIRSTITNASTVSRVEMSGGSVLQDMTSYTDAKGAGAIKVDKGIVIITGGTVTSYSTNSAAIDKTNNSGTLIIGTDDSNNAYDATNPVIQGNQYGINASSAYSIYDGIIKGKGSGNTHQAVNNYSRITGTEDGSTRETGQDGDYYTLYYTGSIITPTPTPTPAPTPTPTPAPSTYTIVLDGHGGTFSGNANTSSKEFSLGATITETDLLPEPTKGIYTFDGWYEDSDANTTPVTFPYTIPSTTGTKTFYAKWTYVASNEIVDVNTMSDALQTYFTNINTWKNGTESELTTNLGNTFSQNSCSACDGANSCNTRTVGTKCEQPKGYDTELNSTVDVYLSDAVNKQKGAAATHVTSVNGVLYNLIPGQVYYWELASDSSVHGLVRATDNRRTIYSTIGNVRDLGGLPVSYTENGHTVTGIIDYGRLYRGAKLITSSDTSSLTQLGVTREIDLRSTSEARSNNGNVDPPKLSLYDITGGANDPNGQNAQDIIVTNYIINPEIIYNYSYIGNDNQSHTEVPAHTSEYQALKSAMKAIMNYIIEDNDNIYFHCTIGTDRTGTMAYFLEGLLGASEEDRVEDYEMTYFYGLSNRTRYHEHLGTTVNPRFMFMHLTYPSNQAIYEWFTYGDSTAEKEADDALIADFRNAMIVNKTIN